MQSSTSITDLRGGFQLNPDSSYISVMMDRTDFSNKISIFLLPFPNVLYFIQKFEISTRFSVISIFINVGMKSRSIFSENFAILPVRTTSFLTSPRPKKLSRSR